MLWPGPLCSADQDLRLSPQTASLSVWSSCSSYICCTRFHSLSTSPLHPAPVIKAVSSGVYWVLEHPVPIITSSSVYIAERPRCSAGWVSDGQKWKTNWETMTIFYGHYRSVFNHCDVIGQQSNRIRWKTKNKGYYAVQGHWRSSRSVSMEIPYATSY